MRAQRYAGVWMQRGDGELGDEVVVEASTGRMSWAAVIMGLFGLLGLDTAATATVAAVAGRHSAC